MRRLFPLLAAVLTLWLFSGGLASKTLTLPESLVSLNSQEGEQLLLHSEARQSYWNLSVQFLTQKTQAFCGVASIVMVLNAIGIPSTDDSRI